jgi:hypothetical protein
VKDLPINKGIGEAFELKSAMSSVEGMAKEELREESDINTSFASQNARFFRGKSFAPSRAGLAN